LLLVFRKEDLAFPSPRHAASRLSRRLGMLAGWNEPAAADALPLVCRCAMLCGEPIGASQETSGADMNAADMAQAQGESPGSPHWFSAVETAHIAGSVDAVAWDDAADFVVVGYGGAGVAASIEAAESGLSVLAIDRFHGGGATVMNGGVFYAGGGTRIQREAGVEDSPAEMFSYLQPEVGGVVSDRTLWRFCAESPAQLDWMMAHGVEFNARLFAGKTSYPTADYYLYHSDSSLAASAMARAKPAARGHRAYMPATTSAVGYGVGLYDPLTKAAADLGVRVMVKAEARQLVLDPAGRVLGVKVLQIPPGTAEAAEHDRLERKGMGLLLKFPPAFPGARFFISRAEKILAQARALEARHRKARYIQARRGVCLSAGGFVFNREMIAHYAPRYLKGMPLGSPGDDGSGIRLGQTAGGATERLGHVSAWRFINPPAAWARGMIVNRHGARFVDETLYGASIGLKMVEENDGRAWLILDAALRRQVWEELRHGKILPFQRYPAMLAMLFGSKSAPTLAALAAKCGFDGAVLEGAFLAYNQAASGAAPDAFAKGAKDMAVLRAGPYQALDISIDATLEPLPTLTLGGLKVDEETGAVLGVNGAPIAGLYAAGRTAIGVCSNIYVSGLSSADCVFSGRRAGRAAAA
jgi:3-oxo-5alpha-steroid 4-dehydrogenase